MWRRAEAAAGGAQPGRERRFVYFCARPPARPPACLPSAQLVCGGSLCDSLARVDDGGGVGGGASSRTVFVFEVGYDEGRAPFASFLLPLPPFFACAEDFIFRSGSCWLLVVVSSYVVCSCHGAFIPLHVFFFWRLCHPAGPALPVVCGVFGEMGMRRCAMLLANSERNGGGPEQ